MTKVLVLVNTLSSVQSFVYANHIEFFTKAVKAHPEIDFKLFTPHRMSIDRARNQAAEMALRWECSHILFLDDDVMVPSNAFDMLYAADKDIICGLVVIRGMPFDIMAFKFMDEAKSALAYYNKLPLVAPCTKGHTHFEVACVECFECQLEPVVECDAVGFSLCLIKTDVLAMLTPPYFVTGPNHTEDVYFCLKAKDELDPPPGIFMHTGVRCGHLLNPEPIEFATRKKMFEFYLDEWKAGQAHPSRDASHIQRCLASLTS